MAISYYDLAVIGGLTNTELEQRWHKINETEPLTEDEKDTLSAIETEMESREMPHP